MSGSIGPEGVERILRLADSAETQEIDGQVVTPWLACWFRRIYQSMDARGQSVLMELRLPHATQFVLWAASQQLEEEITKINSCLDLRIASLLEGAFDESFVEETSRVV